MKFAANISTLFKEHDFLNRFNEAKKFGFTAVEMQFPYEYSPKILGDKRKESGLEVVLLNCIPGEDFGCASIPGRDYEFMMHFSNTLKYAFELEPQKLHILSGLKSDEFTEEEQLDCYVTNLNNLTDVLEEHGIIGLIEPICSEVIPNYFLESYDKAMKVIDKINSPYMKLLLDVYHLKKIEGEVSLETLQKLYGYAGHIQISQDPGRYEPFHPSGCINYTQVLEFFTSKGHSDFIGLEYFASGTSLDSLKWIKSMQK